MFDKVVFAGGGHRCWWQAGFWDTVTREIELRPRVIGAVSAGAATACLLYANDSRRALAWYERELAGVRSNVNWLNLLRRGRPLFPHAAIYRKALRALLGGDHFRRLMWHGPEIRVQLARLPEGMGPRQAMFRGLLAYQVEKRLHGGLHPGAGKRVGFVSEVRRVQDCRGERELVDLIIASSCTPPFTPMELYDGALCLDGGMIDNVPCDLVDDVPGPTLVLLTRRYKGMAPVFARGDRVYVQPSEPVAVSSWDYTSPKRYLKTYELGRKDGERFLQTFALGRHRDSEHFAGVFLGDAMAMDGAAPQGGDASNDAVVVDVGATMPFAAASGLALDTAMSASGPEASDPPDASVIPDRSDPVAAAAPMIDGDAGPAAQDRQTGAAVAADAVNPANPADSVAKPVGASGEGTIEGTVAGPVTEPVEGESAELSDAASEAASATIAEVSARRAAGQGSPSETGADAALKASQPSPSLGQLRSGRSFRASRI